VFRPDIFIRACWRKLRARPNRCVVQTAWGDWLEVEPRKFIGANLYMRGVHELAVCEVLWRLASAGETVVDAGANIGVMTSLLSKKVGESGRALAFEAHPGMFRQLELNSRRWNRRQIELFDAALSARAGAVRLCEGIGFAANEGTARVAPVNASSPCHEVEAIRLDDLLPCGTCGVIKIDVEGHEADVLAGAAEALGEQRLRDVVFESTWDFPGAAHERLLAAGYRIFSLEQSLFGPKLARLHTRSGQEGRLTDYVATVDAARALGLAAPAGWQVLGCAWERQRLAGELACGKKGTRRRDAGAPRFNCLL
jgi:FkbM family methyltransferase